MYEFGRVRRMAVMVATGLALTLSACGGSKDTFQRAPEASRDPEDLQNRESAIGGAGVNLFRGSDTEGTEGAVAVNAFLWRASLDTLAFMPLASADPFGGVIITDWYAPPETPEERFKVNVYILGRALRADGLKVSVFRQTAAGTGEWRDAAVGPEVATEFEEAVLTRARQLRLQAVNEKD
jgi:hypothetical protein